METLAPGDGSVECEVKIKGSCCFQPVLHTVKIIRVVKMKVKEYQDIYQLCLHERKYQWYVEHQ